MNHDVIEETGTRRLRLVQDTDCENPRTSQDNTCHVVTVPGYRYVPVDEDGGPLSDAWDRLIHNGHRWDEAAAIFERYVRVVHKGWTLLDTPYEGANAVWYLLPEDVRAAMLKEPTAEDAERLLKGERDEYRAWAEGDCWGYVVEEVSTWKKVGVVQGEEVTMQTWDEVESCWGFIGHQYAEEEARAAFAD